MNALFTHKPLIKQSFFQRLFKQHPEENAIIELNNLLASIPIQNISSSSISEIEEKYRISLQHKYKLNLQEFYAVYLNHCLTDKQLTDHEMQDLAHLKKILLLDDKEIRWINESIGQVVYKQAVEEAISDNYLSANEKLFLSNLENNLCLPKELAKKITDETKNSVLNQSLSTFIEKQTLSPEEEQDFLNLSRNLDIKHNSNRSAFETFEKLKIYWAIENTELITYDVEIPLQKGEKCYLSIPGVRWGEMKHLHNAKSYIRNVSKGYFLDSGTYSPSSYHSGQIKWIDEGSLYLTTKRILFIGTLKNSIVPYEKILSIAPFNNGVEIGKISGKIPVIRFNDRLDVFCVLLERLLKSKKD